MRRQPRNESVKSKSKVWLTEEVSRATVGGPRWPAAQRGGICLVKFRGFCSWNVDLEAWRVIIELESTQSTYSLPAMPQLSPLTLASTRCGWGLSCSTSSIQARSAVKKLLWAPVHVSGTSRTEYFSNRALDIPFHTCYFHGLFPNNELQFHHSSFSSRNPRVNLNSSLCPHSIHRQMLSNLPSR